MSARQATRINASHRSLVVPPSPSSLTDRYCAKAVSRRIAPLALAKAVADGRLIAAE